MADINVNDLTEAQRNVLNQLLAAAGVTPAPGQVVTVQVEELPAVTVQN